ncbi:T9SS type A sorting domain-containing protein [Subsaxibacter sp. CAU 1640]|uniref:T9SS type A sorting domain-containing protein n=1 Tax=Subsaxibacter sp. CAU 1640 TaxID=2933271 RepID=UPI0020053273|nr:T9SS type A sorting domain-containing protein [Subsaxibacter sp. CAU 1640]MCK7590765.1 T9SS type A sorting domain-containing protein [Subsaxibacter sp. CAU 1640]
MKQLYNLLFIITFLFSNYMISQPNISWERSLGGTSGEIAFSVKQTTDGGYIVAGYSLSGGGEVNGNNGGRDIWVVKLDANGTIVWENNYGGSAHDEAHNIEQTTDGGYILIGSSNSDDFAGVDNYNDFDDIVILKLDNLGQMQWGKFYGTSTTDNGYAIKQTTDGGYIATGYVGLGSHYDAWAAKLDASGNIDSNWATTIFGGPDYGTSTTPRFYSDGFYSVDVATDGYVVCGFTQREGDSGSPQNDYWILKFAFDGSIVWEAILGGDASEEAKSIVTTNDGGCIIAGYTRSDGITGGGRLRDYWIVKLDSDGDLDWDIAYGGSQNDEAASIDQTSDNGYIVLGFSRSNDGDISGSIIPNSEKDYWLVKLTEDGNLDWEKSLGGYGDDDGFCVTQTTDGGYILAGTTTSSNIDIDPDDRSGASDYWVVKLEAETLGYESFEFNEEVIIYPNPSNGIINIRTHLEITDLQLYDSLGKRVLENRISNNQLDVSGISAGIYYLKVLTESKQVLKKLIIN